MGNSPELIVMLTHHDRTVADASRIFDACRDSKAQFWGFKEEGLPLPEMRELFARMRDCGKTTVLEVVEYTPEKCLEGVKMAAECGCDILMGTIFSDEINEFCGERGLRYMPFVGRVSQRPSILEGTPDEMIGQARTYLEKGAWGIDLLGYRYTGDAAALNRAFVAGVDAPVCLAGSVNSYRRLDEVKAAGPWAFTIGGGFFENCFGGSFAEQIDKVCAYMAAL